MSSIDKINEELSNLSDLGWQKASVEYDLMMIPDEEVSYECPMEIMKNIEILQNETNQKTRSFLLSMEEKRFAQAKKLERFNI